MTRTHGSAPITAAMAAVLAVGSAACSVNESGKIKCVDDSSCPRDYPVCSAGVCIEGTSASQNSVAVLGVPGKASTDPLRGTVTVQVTARAASGVKSVSLSGGSQVFTATGTPTGSVYSIPVDTRKLPEGAVQLKAKLVAGDDTTVDSAASSIIVDNTPPTFPSIAVTPATAQQGMLVILDVEVSEPLGSLVGPVTKPGGGNAGQVAEIAPPTPASSTTGEVRHLGYPVTPENPAGNHTVTLTATDLAGNVSAAVTRTFNVVLPPSISGFSASPSVVSSGQSSTLTATFANGTGTVNNGVGTVTNGQGKSTGALSVSTTFMLTVTNAAGVSVTAQASVTVAVPPAITSFTGTGSVTSVTLTAGGSVILTPVFTNGTGQISNSADSNVVAATSGVGFDTGALSSSRTYALTVSNAAGLSVTRTVLVNVVPAPTCTSLVAAAPTVTTGTGTTLTPNFANGTGVLTNSQNAQSLTVGSGSPVSTGNLSARTTFTLAVSNSATTPATCTSTATVTVVAAPAIGTFTVTAPSPANFVTGVSTAVTLAWTGLVGNCTPASGACFISNNTNATTNAITSTVDGSVSPANITQTTIYTLTVANLAGQVATKTVTINAAPQIAVFSASASTVTIVDTVTLTATFTGASCTGTNCQITGTGGFVPVNLTGSGTTNVTVNATTTYTLTVKDAAGVAASAQLTVTAVAAPQIGTNLTASSATNSATCGGVQNCMVASGASDVTLSASFSNGTGQVRASNGATAAMTSGSPLALSGFSPSIISVTSRLTFTLTVTNPAGATLQSQVVTVSISQLSSTTATMPQRSGHTATLLPNGKVLLTGGKLGATLTRTSVIFDATATPPTFTTIGNDTTPDLQTMQCARTEHAAVLLPNGKVLVGGGCSPNQTTDLYDPFSGTNGAFSSGPTLVNPNGRKQFTMSAVPGTNGALMVLIAGGRQIAGAAADDTLGTTEKWDLNTAANFTAGPPLISAQGRALHTATVLQNGRILLTGGEQKSGATITAGLNTAEVIDLVAGTSTAVLNNMLAGRQQHAAVRLNNGSVMLFGGTANATGGAQTGLNTVEFYGITTGQFDTVTVRITFNATGRFNLTATMLTINEVLLVGGSATTAGGATSAIDVYDPFFGSGGAVESGIPQLKVARTGHSATPLLNGTVAILGGNASGSAVAEIFNPSP